MNLRPYQQDAFDAIWHDWKTCDRLLVVKATGTGKTILFSAIAREAVARGGRVLILAHRGELLNQAQDKLTKATGLQSAREQAGQFAVDSWYSVIVASIDTLRQDKRLEMWGASAFTHIIIDEAHRSLSKGYRKVLDFFKGYKLLGVTATPDRGDQRNLGRLYEKIAFEYSMVKAIREKYLSPIIAKTVPLKIDLGKVGVRGGDLSQDEIAHKLEPYLEQIADCVAEEAKTRKKIVCFLPLIAISQQFCDLLNARGVSACEINGMSKDRTELLADFSGDKYQVLCNAMLLTEGWDEPAVDCIVFLRLTKVRSLYCQAVGRGTRLHPGKKNLLLLDFLWAIDKHELVRPAYLIAEDEETAKASTEVASENAGQEYELGELVGEGMNQVLDERKQNLAKALQKQRQKKGKLLDPLRFAQQMNNTKAITPGSGTVTQEQMQQLEQFGVGAFGIDQSAADKLIGTLRERKDKGLATAKQVNKLKQVGYVNAENMTFEQARLAIIRLAGNGWRRK